jgi:hypothetical protein
VLHVAWWQNRKGPALALVRCRLLGDAMGRASLAALFSAARRASLAAFCGVGGLASAVRRVPAVTQAIRNHAAVIGVHAPAVLKIRATARPVQYPVSSGTDRNPRECVRRRAACRTVRKLLQSGPCHARSRGKVLSDGRLIEIKQVHQISDGARVGGNVWIGSRQRVRQIVPAPGCFCVFPYHIPPCTLRQLSQAQFRSQKLRDCDTSVNQQHLSNGASSRGKSMIR